MKAYIALIEYVAELLFSKVLGCGLITSFYSSDHGRTFTEYQLEMSGLRSEHISNRLFFFMLVIILSLLFMAVPLIVNSYQEYLKTKQALVEIKSLRSNC